MTVSEIILMCIGAVGIIYGEQLNSNIEAQLENIFSTGTANPGSVYVCIGIGIAVVGLILLIMGIVKRTKKNTDE